MTDITPTRPPTAEEKARWSAEAELFRQQARQATAEADVAEIKRERERLKWADEQADAKHRQIYYFDESVGPNSARTCAKQLETWSHQYPECEMEIIFTSPGGSVIDGLYLFDVIQDLRQKGHRVVTGTYGMAASMAGILLQAGEHRWMSEQCWILIHKVSFGAQGSFDDVEDRTKWINRIQDRVVKIFVARAQAANGSLTARKLKRNWTRRDWWLSSDEALELGVVDEVRGGLIELGDRS